MIRHELRGKRVRLKYGESTTVIFFSYPCRCIQGNQLWLLLLVPNVLCIRSNYFLRKSVGKYVDEGGGGIEGSRHFTGDAEG